MYKIFCFITALGLLISCKKGDIQTPLEENLLKGKLKSIVISGKTFPTSEELEYHFEYDENGQIQKILAPQNAFLELLDKKDSLVLRYQFESEGEQSTFLILVEHENKSIKGFKLFSESGESISMNEYRIFESGGHLDSIQSSIYSYYPQNVFFLNSGVSLSNYHFYEDGYELNADYSTLGLLEPAIMKKYIKDTIRVFTQKRNSAIPLPTQTLSRITPWTSVGNDFISLSIYFLQLEGFQIHRPFSELPYRFLLNGNEWMDVDYQWNVKNQVEVMRYRFAIDAYNSDWSFTYYE